MIRILVLRTLRADFRTALSLETGVRLGVDAEKVHDMRVSIRKIRATLRNFEDYLPNTSVPFQGELRWIATSLGRVRDFDVLQKSVLVLGAECDPKFIEDFLSKLEVAHERARRALLRNLDSARYKRLIHDFGQYLAARHGTWPDKANENAARAGGDVLHKRYRAVKSGVGKLTPKGSSLRFHRVRKRAKRLRYAAELLGDMFGKPAKKFIAELKGFQDAFGNRQDAVSGAAQVSKLLKSSTWSREDVSALKMLEQSYRKRERELRRDCLEALYNLKKPWKRLKQCIKGTAP